VKQISVVESFDRWRWSRCCGKGSRAITTGEGFSGFIDELRIYDRPFERRRGATHIRGWSARALDRSHDAVAASRKLRV